MVPGTDLVLTICLINKLVLQAEKLVHDIFAASIHAFSSSFPVILFHENAVSSHFSCYKYNQLKLNHPKKQAIISRHICIKNKTKQREALGQNGSIGI